jgi:uncharacterized Zn-binding protein involved in type VI secretion
MPGQGRLGDKANISADAHGCPGCPHPGTGPAIAGSPDVFVNGRPALRVDDVGLHAACCGPNMWQAQQGSSTVFINGRAAFRLQDPTRHCGGQGQLIEGSDNVLVGDAGGGGSGSSAGSQAADEGQANASPSAAQASDTPASSDASASDDAPTSASAPSSSASPTSAGDAQTSDDATAPDEDQLEVEVVNALGEPQPGIDWELTLPDGSTKSGRTLPDGFIRLSGLTQRGSCQLTFPNVKFPRRA